MSVLYHTLQGAENYAIYARDAEQEGDREIATFFRQMVDDDVVEGKLATLDQHISAVAIPGGVQALEVIKG